MIAMTLLNAVTPGRAEEPARISSELRHSSSAELARRRGVIGLALVGAGAMAVVSLYQTGALRHVPEPPLPGFDADRVDASEEAYASASTPSGLLGLTSFAVTATLAGAGGADRARRRPWLALALAAKGVADALGAGKLTYHQWKRHRAWCLWSVVGAIASIAMLPLIAPDALDAVRRVRHRWSDAG